MTTTLQSKYHLSTEQLSLLVADGKATKTTWYARNLTTNNFIDYAHACAIRRTPGDQCFNAVFPTGFFQPGTEIKVAVGDWNVLDENGRHCLQTAFFYIPEDGEAIPCKYGELPSQNNGVIPMAQEQYPYFVPGAAPPVVDAQQTLPQTPAPATSDFEIFPEWVSCQKSKGDIFGTTDTCSMFDASNDNALVDPVCPNCVHCIRLYSKKN